jgi:hypothetical protein
MKLVFEYVIENSIYGLKSIINSLSMIPELSPGLFNDLKNRALALNSSLFMIPETQLIF